MSLHRDRQRQGDISFFSRQGHVQRARERLILSAAAFAARIGAILSIRSVAVVAASAGLRNVADLGLLEL